MPKQTIEVSVRKLTSKDVLMLVVDEEGTHPAVLPRDAAKTLGNQLLLAARLRAPKKGARR